MREIKFRVRDNNTKKIVGYEVVINGVWNREYTGESHKISKWNDGSFSKQYIREQFTGLTDDDGTDIYEGDIAHNIGGDIYEIKFDDGKFVAILDGNVVIDLCELNNDIVIIGNIFENPELINL